MEFHLVRLVKRLLLVAATTGYQTQMFADAAKELGVDVVLATDRCHVLDDPWRDRALAIRFEDPETAAEAATGLQVDGIVALGDRPAGVAAAIARRLGLPYNSPESVAACRNKYEARRKFASAGLPVPEFRRIALDDAAHQSEFPCVLKPLGLSASRGVIRADSPAEFAAAFRRIAALLRSPEIARLHEPQDRFIQVERFIPGREFALEGILSDGRLQVIAIFDKPDPLDGPFFEETIYVTPSRESAVTQNAMVEATQTACAALGLTRGPVHAEMRVNPEGVWMLEVAARPIGGLCGRVLPDLARTIVRHALNEANPIPPASEAAGVMMIPIPRAGVYRGVEGVAEALQVPAIHDIVITAKEGQPLIPLPEGSSYLGFIFARGGDPDRVEQALRDAHARLRFEIASALKVVG
jgi:D-alanine-D-alanine ligase-like ATP-grasp enzyme